MAARKKSVRKYGPMKKKPGQAGFKMEKTLREFGTGKLRSGSKAGPKVRSRKQAIAIGMSEARAHGEPKAKKPKAVPKVRTKAIRHRKAKMPKPSLAKAEKAMNKAAHRRVRNIGRS